MLRKSPLHVIGMADIIGSVSAFEYVAIKQPIARHRFGLIITVALSSGRAATASVEGRLSA